LRGAGRGQWRIHGSGNYRKNNAASSVLAPSRFSRVTNGMAAG